MSSNAFNASSLIKATVEDLKSDFRLPDPGLLSWKDIKSDTALNGTKGADCVLVHGDAWRQIDQNQTVKITRDQEVEVYSEKYTIKGSQKREITGTLDDTVKETATYTLGDRLLHVLGNNLIHTDQNRDITVGGTDTEHYASPREIDEPAHFETTNTDLAWKTWILETCALKMESCTGVHLEISTLEIEAKLLKNAGEALSNKLHGLESKIPVLGSRLAALDLKLATRINGAPTESVTAPIAGA